MNTDLKKYLIVFIISICSCTQHKKQILVLPGKGLLVGEDSILLYKTNESEIFHLFKMTDTSIAIDHGSACGFDENGDAFSLDTYFKEIKYDGIVFYYKGGSQKDSLSLEEIEISDTTHWTVKVNNSIVMGKTIPDLLNYFPRKDSSDDYNEYSKDLWSYGINFGLKDNGSKKKLNYISIYRAQHSSE